MTKHDKRIACHDSAHHHSVIRELWHLSGEPDFCTMKSNSKLYRATPAKGPPNSQPIDRELVASYRGVEKRNLVKKR
jgi:hypothetical protein